MNFLDLLLFEILLWSEPGRTIILGELHLSLRIDLMSF